ncbi:MAG TPA: hypothetical protein VF746_14725 [Longimicrobium sp.]|jgi:hypothetical protein
MAERRAIAHLFLRHRAARRHLNRGIARLGEEHPAVAMLRGAENEAWNALQSVRAVLWNPAAR